MALFLCQVPEHKLAVAVDKSFFHTFTSKTLVVVVDCFSNAAFVISKLWPNRSVDREIRSRYRPGTGADPQFNGACPLEEIAFRKASAQIYLRPRGAAYHPV